MAKKKEEKTNVMRILDQKKIPYTARFYDDSQGPEGTREYGVHVAAALGQDPARGFKTLVARGASKGGRWGRSPSSFCTWRRSTPSPAISGADAAPWA